MLRLRIWPESNRTSFFSFGFGIGSLSTEHIGRNFIWVHLPENVGSIQVNRSVSATNILNNQIISKLRSAYIKIKLSYKKSNQFYINQD